jgi:hypothetical protein
MKEFLSDVVDVTNMAILPVSASFQCRVKGKIMLPPTKKEGGIPN